MSCERIRNWNEVQADLPGSAWHHRPHRFTRNQNRGSYLTALDLFEGFGLRHADFLNLNAKGLEDIAHRVTRSAALCIEVDLKTRNCSIEVISFRATRWTSSVNSLVIKTILLSAWPIRSFDRRKLLRMLVLREADIDASQVPHVADVLGSTDAGDRENAKIVAVIEDIREIVRDLQIGIVRVRTAGYQTNCIFVGLLVFIYADTDEIIAHPFDPGRLVLDGFCDGVEPAVVDPTVSGGSAGGLTNS